MVQAEIPLWVVHPSSTDNLGTTSQHQQSLKLLQGRQKCAIYSVDLCPPLMATAGGDGKVKLWNTRALFVENNSNEHAARFDDKGTYVSSSSDSNNNSEDDDTAKKTNGGTTSGSEAETTTQVHDLNSVVRRKKDDAASPARKSSAAPASNVINASPSRGKHHHRLICTLSAHTGSSVLCVRFSPSGKYLASAGDDAVVCIYAPTANQPQQWNRIKLCRGHGLDVVDLAWAPDDSHLVSCSLDSATPIIVWKLQYANNESTGMICNPYKVLGQHVHTSTVKGVAFDPAGSYLASSGDDPAICIWRAHDDWGLEKRIEEGIFRKWSGTDDLQALSNQSMFRRLSWSTDGAFLCATNAVVKNKHVASTIGREGWTVATGGAESSLGAATLVGHKQPVVVSRHAAELLNGSRRKRDGETNDGMDVDDDDPDSATLLALGDRRGFLTVWSTLKSRPLFKLQCSETRSTVTDLSWGRVVDKRTGEKGDMILVVSLLDGQLVALRFSVPTELGPFLNTRDQQRVFQHRYGIDIEDSGRPLVGRNTGSSQLVENALQLSLEETNEQDDLPLNDEDDDPFGSSYHDKPSSPPVPIRQRQQETRDKGKKRVRPILMSISSPPHKRQKEPDKRNVRTEKTVVDPMQAALLAAEKASAVAGNHQEGAASDKASGTDTATNTENLPVTRTKTTALSTNEGSQERASVLVSTATRIPYDTDRVKYAELPPPRDVLQDPLDPEQTTYGAECANTTKIPTGSQGSAIPCIDVIVKLNNRVSWRDQIPGATCSAVTASHSMLAVGTTDGCVQLYANSPNLGWSTGLAFRSHPPLIFGHAVVRLRFHARAGEDGDDLDLLVVTADGAFSVYGLCPSLVLRYKGSILPAMTHMALASLSSDTPRLPKLSRIQITPSGHLLMLLSWDEQGRSETQTGRVTNGVGGSLQAYTYDRLSELWLRISDGRFVLSDFFTTLPVNQSASALGPLSQIEDSVKLGSLQSSLKSSHRNRNFETDAIYAQAEDSVGNHLASRSHCEDRMACSLALKSSTDFKYWLIRYVRTLAVAAQEEHLRMLVSMLMGTEHGLHQYSSWWLSSSPDILRLDRKALVKDLVKEMSKNRALQRLTSEISIEIQDA